MINRCRLCKHELDPWHEGDEICEKCMDKLPFVTRYGAMLFFFAAVILFLLFADWIISRTH